MILVHNNAMKARRYASIYSLTGTQYGIVENVSSFEQGFATSHPDNVQDMQRRHSASELRHMLLIKAIVETGKIFSCALL